MRQMKLTKRLISRQMAAFFVGVGFIFISASSSLAAELTCPSLFTLQTRGSATPSLSQQFSLLAQNGAFIGQKDDQLNQRGLRIRGGGLCGLACASSVLVAALEYTGKRSETETIQADLIQKMVFHIKNKFQLDPRLATTPSQVASALSELALEEDVDLIASPLSITSLNGYDPKKLTPPKNTMLILFLESPTAPAESPGHAVVLSSLEPERRQIRYSDLNFPKVILSAPYEEVTDPRSGLKTLRLNIPNWSSGSSVPWTIYSLVEVQVLELPAP